ncbi:YjcQ family protein [Ezakiella coagulans]|uniref:YjcQ family protein n=1 Tax=Ezakiella coagulans TaxID=46507 RepID=UPI0028893A94|nr:YjcQ family protein [Ezakiella coagulans]
MAKDDYFVIAYKILAYLYANLKACEDLDVETIMHNSPYIDIGESYWCYIIEHLLKDGYIEGISIKNGLDGFVYISNLDKIRITPLGIEFLKSESTMQKAKDFLKDIKAMIPMI